MQSISKIVFDDQDTLDWWNSMISALELPQKIDIVSVWRLYDENSNKTSTVGFVLKTYDKETKKYVTVHKMKITPIPIEVQGVHQDIRHFIIDEFIKIEKKTNDKLA